MITSIFFRTILKFSLLSLSLFLCITGCKSSDAKDAIEIVEGVPRKSINKKILGVNAFGNDPRFGDALQQSLDIRDNLKLSRIRILFDWNDAQHQGLNESINFSFMDYLVNSIPDGVSAIVVVTNVPSWMNDGSNWVNGNPIDTYVERWLRPIVRRYKDNNKIEGYQIWNEPNMAENRRDNEIMGFIGNPKFYVEMLSKSFAMIKKISSEKLVINAATTSINQNFPTTLDYNKSMIEAGLNNFTDVFAFHFYGKQYERVLFSGGVKDFINSLNKQVFVTESGAQGVNNQLAYGEEVWPFLTEKMPNISRIYIYKYDESVPSATSYGLRTLDPNFPISDLYLWLSSN